MIGPLTWRVRIAHPEVGEETLVLVAGDERPPGTVVDLADLGPWPADSPRILRVRYRPAERADQRAVVRVQVSPEVVPVAPPLWYAVVDEPDSEPAATTLIAFEPASDEYPDGAVLDADQLAEVGIGSDDQVGAVRWWPHLGLVHQIFVARHHRKRGIGRKLAFAAAGVGVVRGEPSLHGGNYRTPDGDRWLSGAPALWRSRLLPADEIAPSMDPD